ncbi:MAG: DUF2666 family protein [Theionarchaea archaeon]|nr:DUF2666 family protein [Theionarchaea archaeon]
MEVPGDHVSFTAKHKGWIVAKKMEIDETAEDIDVARLLISIRETFENKIYEYLGKDIDIEVIDTMVDEIVPSGRLNEDKIASILATLKGGAVTRKLSEIADTKEKKNVAKAILVEKALTKMKLAELTPKMIDKYAEKR